MSCYRTILVGFDGSPDAKAALLHAGTLARDQHARLVVLTVVPPPVYVNGMGTASAVMADLESAFASELNEAIQTLPSDIGVESRLTTGRAAPSILEVAEQTRCDLIVMGFHGHGRIHHALAGSVSDTVARESRRPVLLVHANYTAPMQTALSNSPGGSDRR